LEKLFHQYGAKEITIEEPALIIVINKLFWYGMLNPTQPNHKTAIWHQARRLDFFIFNSKKKY